jgi:imidazole glycerol phosphate synthase subunit HisF
MSLNYVKDPGVQIPNLNAAGDGVDAVVRYYQNGTDEVKNLLKNECSMIYECR